MTVGVAPGYVSDQTCAECHSDLMDSYHHVGMSRSFARPGPETIIEDLDALPFYHEASDRYYQMQARDGDYYVRRFQLDEDGQPYNELEEKIDFIMGSGSNVRSYFYQTDVGELYQVPHAWYPRQNAWGMSPGYEAAGHSGFTRQITQDCMFCHNAYPDMPVGSDHVGQPHRFPSQLPSGLGCQRCHGPGAVHLEVAHDPFATVEQLRDSIVNPGRLDPQLRDDVCLQCHLQPDSQIMSLVRRTDRGMFSYRPGEPLAEYLTPIDHSLGQGQEDRFQINHHPYRLFQSRCYLESDGQMSCLTCHDPHVKVPVDQRSAHYRAACLSCHQLEQCDIASMQVSGDETAAADVDCVNCHMVRRRTQDVVEVLMTDHLIRRGPPADDPTAPLHQPLSRASKGHTVFWTDREQPVRLQEAIAQCAMNDPEGIESLQDALDDGLTESNDAKLVLAGALWNAGRYEESLPLFRKISEDEADLAYAHEMYGRSLLELGEPERALAALRRAWELDEESASTAYGLGLALNEAGRRDEALASFRAATKLRPNYPDAHLRVGALQMNARDYQSATHSYAQVHRIDPLREDGYYFHGLSLLLAGETPQAITVWRRGLRAVPVSGRLQLALATGLIMQGQGRPAAQAAELARVQGADPVNCDLVDTLIRNRLKQPQAARDSYEAAMARLSDPSSEPSLRAVLLQLVRQQMSRRR